jgi:hypothetical protein
MERIDRATSVTVWGMVRGRRTEAVPIVGRVQFEVVRLKLGECVVDRQIWPVVSSYTVSLLGPPQTSVVFALHPVEQSLSLNNEEVGIELLHPVGRIGYYYFRLSNIERVPELTAF